MALGLLTCCMAALLPAVMLYFPNMAEIPFADMLPYFGIPVGLAVLVWAGMYLITRRKWLSAAAATICLLVLLNIGRLVPALHSVFPLLGFKVIAPVTLVLLAAAAFGLSRLKEEFLHDACKVAAFALAAFILSSAVPAVISSLQTENSGPEAALDIDITPARDTDRPNIYWIIPDEYAGSEELDKYFHYDNTPFYATLREMGFTVSENSYNWTTSTFKIIRDILNLKYLKNDDSIQEELVADPDAPLWTLLRELGYEICEAESMDKFRLTDRLESGVRGRIPETANGETVANLLLRYSILYRYEEEIISRLLPRQSEKTNRELILNVFDWAENAKDLKTARPSCTVLYVKCPHVPFLFDRDGNEVPSEHRYDYKDRSYFLDQLYYVSVRLEKTCRAIIAADPDSIILLQSDHGVRQVPNVTLLDQGNILNAVYFRGEPMEEIPGRNGLNTWIAVLRKQFRLDIPYAEERPRSNKYVSDLYDPEEEDPNSGLIPPPD